MGSERVRRRSLCRASWALALGGHATVVLLQTLLSTWVHALLCRRPLLALLGNVYQDISGELDPHVVCALSPHAWHVFAYLVAMVPAMVTNLGASYMSKVSDADASSYGLGA